MENNDFQKRLWRKWLFFILALGWSWLFWIPLIFLKLAFHTMPGIILYSIGGLGPALSAIYLVRTTQPKDERREFGAASLTISVCPGVGSLQRFLFPCSLQSFPFWFRGLSPRNMQTGSRCGWWSGTRLCLSFSWFQHYFLVRCLKRSVGVVTGWKEHAERVEGKTLDCSFQPVTTPTDLFRKRSKKQC